VGHRLEVATARDERAAGGELIGGKGTIALGVQLDALQPEGMPDEDLGIEPRSV
jgi:hypothetical protein